MRSPCTRHLLSSIIALIHGGAAPAVQPPRPVTEDEVIYVLDLALDGNWLLAAKYETGNHNSARGRELRMLVPLRIGAAGETEFARVNGLEGDETRGVWAYEVEEIFDRSIESNENPDPLFTKLKFFKAGKFIEIKPYTKVFGLENVVLCLQSHLQSSPMIAQDDIVVPGTTAAIPLHLHSPR